MAHSNYRDGSVDQKIDFVIAWVDGNDPDWQVERKRYANDSKGDNRNIRFRDWNNLHYWFRSIEKCTPWVNKIYFIISSDFDLIELGKSINTRSSDSMKAARNFIS